MTASISSSGATDITFESFGVRIRVQTDTPEVMERIPAILPPDAQRCPPSTVQDSFGVIADEGGSYEFTRRGHTMSGGLKLESALMVLENQIRVCLGMHAPNRIFVHAGVVGHEGRAIVVPGLSFSGKTTLVLELVRAGALYYSDEYAVLDDRRHVHPFAAPPSVRDSEALDGVDLESLKMPAVDEPLPIAAVVLTTYHPGARWTPTRLSPGRGTLAVLGNAVPALTRSQEAMRVISRAIEGAVILEGERGEAREVVPRLLDAVSM